MSEEIQLLSRDGIITSVVTSSSLKSTYQDLIGGTGGIFANIYGNFGNELLALADMIGGEVNEGNWIPMMMAYQTGKNLRLLFRRNSLCLSKHGSKSGVSPKN